MEKFKKFEIKKATIITGGTNDRYNENEEQGTVWYGLGGASQYDMYDGTTIFY